MLGTPELIVIFLIIMLIYGGTRLPAMGRGLGEGIRHFREGLKGESETHKSDSHAEPAAKTPPKSV